MELVRLPAPADETPTLFDHALASRGFHVAALVLGLLIAITWGGVTSAIALVVGILALHTLPFVVIQRHARFGRFRRAAFLAERLRAHTPSNWLIVVEAMARLQLGERERTKKLIADCEAAQPDAGQLRICAVLKSSIYAGMGDVAGALEVLPVESSSGRMAAVVHLQRAWLLHWSGRDDEAAAERAAAGALGLPMERHLEGLRLLESGGDAVSALDGALRSALADGQNGIGVLLDLVLARLERGDEPTTCLEQLSQVDAHRGSIGPTGEAEYHFLRGLAFEKLGDAEQATTDCRAALDLPALPRLRARIEALAARLGCGSITPAQTG